MANIPGNIRESKIAFGVRKQTDIATANIVTDIWRLLKLNAGDARPKLIKESDQPEFGKGHEFATTEYKSHKDVSFQIEKYLTSEIMAWAASFGLGNAVKTGAFVYTCTPLDLPTTMDLPTFSFLEQLRTIDDYMAVGCAVEGFEVTVGYGPGRANSKIVIDVVGSGRCTEPSALVIPAATAEHTLPSASLALTIIGVDYVTLKNILSLTWGWKNNIRLDQGFYPGSGSEDGYAVRGRMEVGDRQASLRFKVRMTPDSLEHTKLKAMTTGTAVITQTFDAAETYTATFQQVSFATVERTDADGIVTVDVVCTPQYHSTNGVLSVVAKTATDNICQAPA